MSVEVPPTEIVAVAGNDCTEVTGANVTVKVLLPGAGSDPLTPCPGADAVIVTVPGTTAVTSPD